MSEEIIVAATQNRHKIREIEAITAKYGMKIIGRDDAGIPDVEIVEDGDSFEENSYKKAYEIMKLCGRPTIADDSGLEVDCLGGAPGIFSARFAEMKGYPAPEDMKDGAGYGEDPAAGGTEEDPAALTDPAAGGTEEDSAALTDPAAGVDNAASGTDPASADGIDKDNNRKLIRLISNVPYEKRTARFVSVITMVFPDGETLVARGTVEGHLMLEEVGEEGFGYDPMFVPEGYDRTFGQIPPEIKNQISHRSRALKKLEELLLHKGEKATDVSESKE